MSIGARRLLRSAASVVLTVLVGGFAAAALVRYSPGFDVDENSWNPKLSETTALAIRSQRASENNLPRFYVRYLGAALRGDFGESSSFHVPVSQLVRARFPVTAWLIFWGVAGGVLLGACLAWIAVWPGRAALHIGATSLAGILIAIPPAVLALGFFFAGAPLGLAVALVVMPRVFGIMRAKLDELYQSSALLSARARGVRPIALLTRYVLTPAAPQLAALAGISFVLAFGAAIPIESLCDVPGIGQLAWKAALSRDLPLLCGLALIITFFVTLVEALGGLLTDPVNAEAA